MSIVFAMVGAGVVLAHANLVRSEPAANSVVASAPAEVRLWFSEASEPRFSEVWLFDSGGQPVQSVGPVRSDQSDDTLLVVSVPSLSPGVYTVAWKAVSKVDGHVTQSSFAFQIGGQAPAVGLRPVVPSGLAAASGNGPSVPNVIVHWLGYLAMALLAGGFAFLPLVLQPALKKANISALPAQSQAALPDPAGPVTTPLVLAGVMVAAWELLTVTTLASAVLQAAESAGVGTLAALGGPLTDLLFGTRYGVIFWIRLVLTILLGALVALHYRRANIRNAPLAWWIGFSLSSLVLLTTSLNSHAAAGSDPILSTYDDWLHLNAVSVWVGGLVALSLALPWLSRRTKGRSAGAVAHLVSRFSRVATICVIVVGVTGVYNAFVEVGDLGNLFDTPYGTTLLFKLSLLLLVLGLAAVNLLLIKGNLERAVAAPEPETALRPWYQRVRQTVGGEVLSVSAIILVTSILVGLPPARDATANALTGGLTIRGQAADLRVVLAVDPGQAGFNSFDAYVQDDKGAPVTDAEKVSLIFSMLGMDMGQAEAVTSNAGNGHYLAQGGYVPMVGMWQVQVLVRRQGQDDVRVNLILKMSR